MKLADLAAAIGRMKVTDWPSLRAARLAGELLEELRRPMPHGRCDVCGWPNEPDGCCSRRGCCNSD